MKTACVDCKKNIQSAVRRPTYFARAMGRTFRPLPRCGKCRTEYERTHTGLQKVKD